MVFFSQRARVLTCTVLLCLLSWGRTSSTLAQDRPARPAARADTAVWELCDMSKTWRVILFQDGRTSEREKWSLDGTRLKIGQLDGRLTQDRLSITADAPGGGTVIGKLILVNTMLTSKPAAKPAEDALKPAAPATKKSTKSVESSLVDTFQLVGTTREGKRIDLPLAFAEDHNVLDGPTQVASWSPTGRQLKLQFVDENLGEAVLTSRNPNEFAGKSKSPNGDNWTWSISRVRVVAVWDTNGAGPTDRVTFYSNGRINKPSGEDGAGYWWLEGRSLQVWAFKGELKPDGRSFTGQKPHDGTISGELISGGLR